MSDGKIAAGFYKGCRAMAGSQQYAINPENGNEQIAIDVFVPELERAFTTFLHFTEKAAPYAIERLRACGWNGEDLSDLTGVDSQEVDVQIKYETFQGKERMKVDIATGGGGRIQLDNQMDDKQKRAFAARMKGLLKGNAVASAKPSSTKSNRTEGAFDPGPPADDLPF
jgi:hypothetical protein